MSQSTIHLWLDDERDPALPFIQEQFGADGSETWVKTVDEALSYLNQDVVVSISFDHDLGDSLATGYELAKIIEEKAFKNEIGPLQWRVHSANPKGANDITAAMTSAERFWARSGE